MRYSLVKILFLLLFSAYSLVAASETEFATLTQKEIKEVSQSIGNLLKTNYVNPEKAKKMASLLMKNYKEGKYNKINDVYQFANELKEDLNSVYQDKHLRISFNPELVKQIRAQEELEEPQIDEDYLRSLQRENFGFKEIKILDGNLGYLDLRGFYSTEFGSETAVAAMNFLSSADALIIDLRHNGGGSPTMIQLISSYLFESKPVHLSGFYWRPDDKYTQNWTMPHVPGKRMPNTDVYILTSNNTFSAAEEFSYNLKHLKRATLIGETTGGGAHPGGTEIVSDRYTIWLPSGRSTNPITNTNWEGVGVKPHIEVSADNALDVAQTKALEKLSEKYTNESGDIYRWYLVALIAKTTKINIDENTLKSYAGSYGPRTLTFENGQLYYQREGRAKQLLKALESDLFMLPNNVSFRLKIIKQDGEVIALQGQYDSGHFDQNLRED